MYNYYTNKKKTDQLEQSHHQRQFSQKLIKVKAQLGKKLVKKFVDRAVHGYQRMVDANKQIKQYRDNQHKFRDFDKSKNIGPPSFYFKPRNDKQRLTDAERENRNLDQIPFCSRVNPSTHKFRQGKSNLNFKFTSYDSASRVIESVQNMKTNEVPTSWDMDIRNYLKLKRQSENTSPSCSKVKKNHHHHQNDKNIKNLILPTLNIKHHPKSLQSIQNRLEIGVLKDAFVASLGLKNDGILNVTDRQEETSSGKCKKAQLNKSLTMHVKTVGPQACRAEY